MTTPLEARSRAWMQTFTGKAFYPLAPTVEDIDIRDIAHALSMICRYGGHSTRFYSVAEHCVLLSHTVAPQNALWALLHDATEAYVGDMIYPLKEEMPYFKSAERNLMTVICQKFGLSPIQPEEVTEHDRRIVLDERDALMVGPPQEWMYLRGARHLNVQVEGWYPPLAEHNYLARFNQLYNKETRNA